MFTLAEFAAGAARFRAAGITLQTNPYRAQAAANRARRAAAFDALLTSMRQSVFELEITLHKIAWRQAAEVAEAPNV